MNCGQVTDLSTEYVTGEMRADMRAQVEAHLAGCASCSDEIHASQALWAKLSALPPAVASPAMDVRFDAILASHSHGVGAERVVAPSWKGLLCYLGQMWPRRPALQFGFAILLFGLGIWLGSVLPFPRSGAAQSEDVAGLKQMVTLSLLQQQSASERLRGVEWSEKLAAPDERVLSALLAALDSDPNVNVRLAAVEALQQFASRTVIRQGLLASLPRQDSPLVQLELIRLLVELNERDSVPVLKALLQESQLNPTVRERAEWGIEQLT